MKRVKCKICGAVRESVICGKYHINREHNIPFNKAREQLEEKIRR